MEPRPDPKPYPPSDGDPLYLLAGETFTVGAFTAMATHDNVDVGSAATIVNALAAGDLFVPRPMVPTPRPWWQFWRRK